MVLLILHTRKKTFWWVVNKWRHQPCMLKEDILVSCRQNGATGLARYKEDILVSFRQNGATGLARYKEEIWWVLDKMAPLVLHATKKKFGELQTKWRHPSCTLQRRYLVSCLTKWRHPSCTLQRRYLVSCLTKAPPVFHILHTTKKTFCRVENKKTLRFLPEYPMPALFPPWKKYSSGWLM